MQGFVRFKEEGGNISQMFKQVDKRLSKPANFEESFTTFLTKIIREFRLVHLGAFRDGLGEQEKFECDRFTVHQISCFLNPSKCRFHGFKALYLSSNK